RKDALAMAYIGQMLLNSHADIDRFYKMGYHEENPTAKIRLEDKRIAEALLDGRAPVPSRNKVSAPASSTPPAQPQTAEQSAEEPDSLKDKPPDRQKIM